MGMIKHFQITQSKSVQYLYNIPPKSSYLCLKINIKTLASWHYCFWWKWLILLDHRTLKSAIISRKNWWKYINLGKLNVNLIIIEWLCSKMGKTMRLINQVHLTNDLVNWELSRLIEWFLYADSDWIIFGLTTNLLFIFDICWVSAAVILGKNDVLVLVPTAEVLELVFPKSF